MARADPRFQGCGSRSIRGIAHGCGSGTTPDQGIRAATAEADLVAQAAGQTWIASQVCPRGCPIKSGTVNGATSAKKTTPQGPKVLSQNLILKKVGSGGAGGLSGSRIFRVCVAIRWQAHPRFGV
jgi:hypothetical protein